MKIKSAIHTLVSLLFLVSALCGSSAHAQASGSTSVPDRVPAGYHEFEMFGNQSIYLSHYPMFGSIHSYQLLLEVVLTSNEGKDPRQLYLAHKRDNPKTRYSLSPETPSGKPDYWVLPAVIKEGNSFRANIHWQGKQDKVVYLARNVNVQIKKIIYVRLFQPNDSKPEQLTYLLFGSNSESYLAHYVVSYHDFDQILSVKVTSSQPLLSDRGSAIVVTIPGRKDDKAQRLRDTDKMIAGQTEARADQLKVDVAGLIHYEADLEIQH